MYTAFQQGRAANNPAEGWYKGELWFFDNYVIPLAHKLRECGVFGVSGDEYLNYAKENRAEFAQKGELLVAQIVARLSGTSKRRNHKAHLASAMIYNRRSSNCSSSSISMSDSVVESTTGSDSSTSMDQL
jgi:hypothetical protein